MSGFATLRLPSAALLVLVCASALAGQGTAGAQKEAVVSERDAARILREARAEQARFERIRRNNLPWTWRHRQGCDTRAGDEIIGRFCLSHGSAGSDYEPPPEADVVVHARERLVARLAEGSERVPWDGWLVGQQVRYLLEAGEKEGALRVVTSCAAAEWWCAALAGYVHHNSGDPGRADAAFRNALLLLPDEERERWTDLSPLLGQRTLRAYRRLDPAAREELEERFWHFAKPLFMRQGNDVRSEHLSRIVLDILQDRARSTDGIAWGDDLREILLRYGWPTGWERIREMGPSLSAGSPGLVGYYSNSRYEVLPPHELLFPADGDGLANGEWDVPEPRPRTGYTLPGQLSRTRWLASLDHQVAVFRRPSGALVVAAYDVPLDSIRNPEGMRAALALVSGPGAVPLVEELREPGLAGALMTSAPAGPALLSLEVLSEQGGRAARARFGLELPAWVPGELALSDLLLLADGGELPDSLQAAVPLARGSERVTAGERVGVYWEVYGLPTHELQSLGVSLRLVSRRGGWLRRTAERVGVVREAAPIRLRWQEQAAPAEFVSRSMAIEIPRVPPGSYVLELTVTRAGGEPVRAARGVEVI